MAVVPMTSGLHRHEWSNPGWVESSSVPQRIQLTRRRFPRRKISATQASGCTSRTTLGSVDYRVNIAQFGKACCSRETPESVMGVSSRWSFFSDVILTSSSSP